jgi:transposase
MTQINDIREAFFMKGRNISEISRDFGIDRKTVRKYISKDDFSDILPEKTNSIPQPKLDPYKLEIDAWLKNDLKARKKQRHTAQRVYNRLIELHDDFNCSYRTVAAYVKEKKKEMYKPVEGYIPLEHKPGEAQVDFGGADFYENGQRIEGHYLNLSFPSSNAGYIQLFKGENQECLFEGMKAIFNALGGVPNRLWFDNASTMVSKVMKNGERNFTEAFLRFAQHHGFAYTFCNPSSGNEKGNVENKVGYHRRNMLVPVPEFEDLKKYNHELLEKAVKDHDRTHYKLEKNISDLHEEDKSHRPITIHSRLYGSSKQEKMNWIPCLTAISRAPGALKYSGIYRMLPDPIQTYLDTLSKKEQGGVLKVIAQLSEKDGFEVAVKSVSEAVVRGVQDIDSLVTLHSYLHQPLTPEKMDLATMSLPKLPIFNFAASEYDGMLDVRRFDR